MCLREVALNAQWLIWESSWLLHAVPFFLTSIGHCSTPKSLVGRCKHFRASLGALGPWQHFRIFIFLGRCNVMKLGKAQQKRRRGVGGSCSGARKHSWLCFRSNFKFFYRVWKIGQFSVLVFGPKWASYERSRSIFRCILREISARAFLQFPKIPQNVQKSKFWGKNKFQIFSGKWLKKQYFFFSNSKACWDM